MKIAVCADLHLNNNSYGKLFDDGLPLKIHDNISALRFFVDECIKHSVDRAVIVGDIYDNQGPNSKVRRLFNECIQDLIKNGIDVSVLVGNHDSCMEHHALEPIKGWNKSLKVIANTSSEIVNDLVMAYIPHTKDIENKKISFKTIIEKLKESIRKQCGKRILVFGHFSVCGAMNNDVFAHFDTKDPSVADLEQLQCEICFLGHFHKRQKLSEKQEIYYVGSLERQSFSERNQEKGFCIYDTDTRQLDWINYNARRMVELSVNSFDTLSDEIAKTDLKDSIVKVKVTGGEGDYARIQQRFGEISDLVANKGAMFFCGLERPKSQKSEDKFDVHIEETGDIDIYKILEDEIKLRSSDQDEDEITERVSLLQEIRKEVDSDIRLSSRTGLTGKRTIRFKWVEYHNFCRFGTERNIIDFDKLFGDSDGIASVVGMVDLDEEEANGAGKSALLEGIAYALYERMPRLCSVDERKKATTTEIIRTDDAGNYACDEAYVKLCIEVEGDEWIIKRGRKLNKSKTSHSAILELSKNGEPYNASKNKEPNQAIIDLVGIDFEPFCNSVFFAQKDTSKIFTSSPGSRIDTILNVLGILRDITLALKIIREDKKKKNKEDIIRLDGKMSVYAQSASKDTDKIQQEINACQIRVQEVDDSILKKSESEEKVQNQKTELEKQRENQRVEGVKIEAEVAAIASKKASDKQLLIREKQSVESLIEGERKKLKEFERKKSELKLDFERETQTIRSVDIGKERKSLEDTEQAKKDVAPTKEALKAVCDKKQPLITEKYTLVGKIQSATEEKIKYEAILVEKVDDLRCPYCNSPQDRQELHEKTNKIVGNIATWSSRIKEIESLYAEIEREEKPLQERLEKLQRLIAEAGDIYKRIVKYENAEKALEQIKSRAKEIKEEYEKSKGQSVEDLTALLQKVVLAIGQIDSQYSQQEKECGEKKRVIDGRLSEIQRQIENCSVQLRSMASETKQLQIERQKYLDQSRDLRSDLKKIQDDRVEMEVIKKQLETERKIQLRISLLEELLGSDGIKSKVAEIYLPVFNKHLNDFMTVLTNGRICVYLDKDNMKPTIRGGSSSSYDMLSGGEKDIIRLAANLALGMVSLGSSRSLPETLFLDEVFGSLAPAMQERVFLLLKHLRSYFKRILVITHIPSLQDRFSRIVRVEKNAGISTINLIGV